MTEIGLYLINGIRKLIKYGIVDYDGRYVYEEDINGKIIKIFPFENILYLEFVH